VGLTVVEDYYVVGAVVLDLPINHKSAGAVGGDVQAQVRPQHVVGKICPTGVTRQLSR